MGEYDLAYKNIDELPVLSVVNSTDEVLVGEGVDGAVRINAALYGNQPGFLRCNTGDDLTISGGAITATHSFHRIDTEAAAASDNVDTINGLSEGDVFEYSPVDTAREINFVTGGNIRYASASPNQDVAFILIGGIWYNWSLV